MWQHNLSMWILVISFWTLHKSPEQLGVVCQTDAQERVSGRRNESAAAARILFYCSGKETAHATAVERTRGALGLLCSLVTQSLNPCTVGRFKKRATAPCLSRNEKLIYLLKVQTKVLTHRKNNNHLLGLGFLLWALARAFQQFNSGLHTRSVFVGKPDPHFCWRSSLFMKVFNERTCAVSEPKGSASGQEHNQDMISHRVGGSDCHTEFDWSIPKSPTCRPQPCLFWTHSTHSSRQHCCSRGFILFSKVKFKLKCHHLHPSRSDGQAESTCHNKRWINAREDEQILHYRFHK